MKITAGMVFGRLTAIEKTVVEKNGRKRNFWKCRCRCGNEVMIRDDHLMSGASQSCGCLQKEAASSANRRETPFVIKGDIAVGRTAQGVEFIIDAEDLNKVSDKTWHINAMGYPQTSIYKDGVILLLHRIIMGDYEKGLCVDHIDRNKLNNRKSNLRICRQGDNAKNAGMRINNTSCFTGVRCDQRNGRWYAEIRANGKSHYLGSFLSFDEAVQARINGEKQYFGEFAPKREGAMA